MWEGESRKYSMPHAGCHNTQTEDLHAWSIYRQNLNADFSESALGVNKSSNSERPFGNFQLKETTVNNILNHPKYGPRIKNQDAYTYLRFGLPRVKTSQSEFGGRANGPPAVPNHHNHHMNRDHRDRPTGSDSSNASEDSPYSRRRNNGRSWKSDPDLIRSQDSAYMSKNAQNHAHYSQNGNNNHYESKSYRTSSRSPLVNNKAQSVADLRYSNGIGHGFKNIAVSGSMNQLDNGNLAIKHPHLIVKNLYYEIDKSSAWRRMCGVRRQKLKVLDNISFEVRAGEVLGLMATDEHEGSAIMNILSNRYNKSRSKVKVDLILNGVYLTPQRFAKLAAYVNKDTTLCPQMSTRQTLLFTSLLQGAAKRSSFDTKKRTNALLEELGLTEVRHTSVSALTEAERRRLLIAINLLLDTDVLMLDQPTAGMDIFDTFFLVEYLRQWALISGRSVIMTISPSTYEIFTMLSRVCLISTGRVVYFGKRKDLLSYFAYIDFPCPAFKNPSDYYLDLVTLDNLSSEAMLESSQRIESLVDVYARRNGNAVSAPEPPSITPPPVYKANFAIQFLALWIRALIFTFPYNVIQLFRNVFIALCLSIMCGIIYWHVRVGREQEFLWDRIGFYHAMLGVMPIPLLLIEINDAHKEKQYILNEIKMQFYSKTAYLLSKILYSLPAATIIYTAFALPACSMAGLKENLSLYIILMIAYLHTLRMIAYACVWTYDRRSSAAFIFGLILSVILFSAGTTFHYKDLSLATRWLYFVSPTRWCHEALIGWEFDSNASSPPYLCKHNPVIQQENAILIKADCGFQTRSNILQWFNYKGASATGSAIRSVSNPFVAFTIVFLVFLVLASVLFCLFARRKLSRDKKKF